MILLIRVIIITKQIQIVSRKNISLASRLYEFNGTGQLLNPSVYRYNKVKLLTNEQNMKNCPYVLVVFSDKGCHECVAENIHFVNKLYTKYNSHVFVYFKGNNSEYLKKFNTKFKYNIIKADSQLFSKKINCKQPIAFLIGKNNIVYDIHRTEVGVSEKTILFFSKISFLFKKMYN